LVRRIVMPSRRVGEDILLFDNYTVTPLMRKPLVTSYTVAVYVIHGEGRAMVNSAEYSFCSPSLLIFVPGQVFQLTDQGEMPIESKVMLLSETFMNAFYGMSFRLNEIFTTLLLNPVIRLDSHATSYLDGYISTTILAISDTDNTHRYDVVKHLTVALFYGTLIGICNRASGSGNRMSEICAKFVSLLKTNFREQHRLEFYASRLCITERYLLMAVKAVTGKSARYWLDYHLLSEARRLLSDTDLSVQEISETLGFVSQSNFGKFFRRLTNLSPSQFRKQSY